MKQNNKNATKRAQERLDSTLDKWLQTYRDRAGQRIPCPYCHGSGKEVSGQNCGFCEDGIHTLGT